MDEDRIRWDERWSGRAAEPAPPDAIVAAAVEPLLPTVGRALDLACGLGATSVWAAQRGVDVVGLDVSPVALAAATELAIAHDVSDRCRFVVADLDSALSEVLGSAQISAESPLELVICQRFRAPHLYREIAGLLAPGGWLVITVLSRVGRDGGSSPFLADPGELLAAFADLAVLSESEKNGEASLVARRR